MRKINLDTPEYTNLFSQAKVYYREGFVAAVQITAEGLEKGEYADKDIRYDTELQSYVINTCVMHEIPRQETVGCDRIAKLAGTRPVAADEWIITHRKAWEHDCDCNYVVTDAFFQKNYKATMQPTVFVEKIIARIIPNDAKTDVEIDVPGGGSQYGDRECYFCALCDEENLAGFVPGEYFILSKSIFPEYLPVENT